MIRAIEKGSKITLSSHGQNIVFSIDDIIGVGGSCIAYAVTYYEGENIPHNGVLKEYCPAFLTDSSDFGRMDNMLNIPEEYADQFYIGLEEFKNTYKNINAYITNNSSARNYHPVQMGLYEGNNTLYTLSSSDYGKSYEKIKDDNVESLIKIMISISKAVEQYHNAGFLHLDIKPKNILILDNVTDIVKLFDFDSLTPIGSLRSNKRISIPVPEDYYVPELNNLNIRNIGLQTDIFEIGAMFYFRLFGRAPSPSDLEYDAVYPMDDTEVLESVSPKAIFEITTLLKKTLQVSPRRRYQNTAQLIDQFKKILELVSVKKPFLISTSLWQPSKHSIERETETREIDNRLDNDGYVFIRGIGGLGKSELVKIYVRKYGFKYHTILFCKYVDSIKSLVAALPIDGINDGDYKDLNSLAKVKNKVLHQCDEHTLIIIDNFNVTHDNYLREFLPVNSNSFKVIFTTRCIPAADYYEDKTMNIAHLNTEDATRLFYMHSKLDINEKNNDSIKQLIEEIQCNTLLLVLVAKAVHRTNMSVDEMIIKLENQTLDDFSVHVFHEYDYSNEEIDVYNKISQHLSVVYDISGLSESESQALLNMTLISSYGISIADFVANTDNGESTYNSIYSLIILGWIELKGNLISLHSITSDVVASKFDEKSDSYYSLCEFLMSQCVVDDDDHISVIQRALAIALQLDRRYIDEDSSWVSNISFILGIINRYLYRPKEARRLFEKSINIENEERDYEALTSIYSQMGSFEEKFGTKTKAVYWYEKSIEMAQQSEQPFVVEVCNSILGMAKCYDEDNQKPLALQKYIETFNYMERNNFTDYIRGVLEKIIELLTELNRNREIDFYNKKLNQYGGKRYSEEIPLDSMLNSGDYEGARNEYENILSELRDELGEESPTYQDYAKYRWMYYLLNNDKEQAMRLVAENLSFIENTYGKNSMEMADFLSTLSYQMMDNCEFDYAIETANRAVSICVSNHQENSYIYAKANMDLISIYVVLGEKDTAKKYIKEIQFNRFSGDEYLSDMIRSVGMALLEIGEYDSCIELCERALSRKGLDRPSKMIAAELLVIYYERAGKLGKAEKYLDIMKKEIESLSTQKFAKYHIITYHRLVAKIMARKTLFQDAISELNTAINYSSDRRSIVLLQCYMERGICYVYENDIESANNDFEQCEAIIQQYGLSDNYYIFIYNNVAVGKMQVDDFLTAKEYFERIIEKLPEVLKPTNFEEATMCQNYGWNLYNLDRAEEGKNHLDIAVGYYDNHGFGESVDYYSALYNLLIVNNSLERFEDNLTVAMRLYNDYHILESLRNCTADFRNIICCAIITGLLATNRENEAYEFANNEEKYYIRKYGKKSIERIDYLQNCAYAFYRIMYTDVFEFLTRAEKVIHKAKLECSVWEARQLNYVGIAYIDLTEYTERGNRYVNASKKMFESLGIQDDYMYEIVVKNCEYARDRMMDKLISDMAKSMIDETEE